MHNDREEKDQPDHKGHDSESNEHRANKLVLPEPSGDHLSFVVHGLPTLMGNHTGIVAHRNLQVNKEPKPE